MKDVMRVTKFELIVTRTKIHYIRTLHANYEDIHKQDNHVKCVTKIKDVILTTVRLGLLCCLSDKNIFQTRCKNEEILNSKLYIRE
jgi:hypothetical protein